MAIIIPSKNVYSNQSDIIKNNDIKLIDIDAYTNNPILNSNSPIFTPTVTNLNDHIEEGELDQNFIYTYQIVSPDIIYYGAYAFAQASVQYADITIEVPRSPKNKYVTKIYDQTNDDGTPQITIKNITGDYKVYGASRSVTVQGLNIATPTTTSVTYGDTNYVLQGESPKTWDYLTEVIGATSGYTTPTEPPRTVTAGSYIEPINNIPLTSTASETMFTLRMKVAVGWSITQISGGFDTTSQNITFVANGNKWEHTAKTLEVTINGDYYEFNLENIKKQVGDTAQQPFAVPSNELLQLENYYGTYNVNQLEYAFSKTIEAYKNGKSTATIRASIGEYYNEDGTLAISTKNSVKQDIVWVSQDGTSATGQNNTVKVVNSNRYKATYRVPSGSEASIDWFQNIGSTILDKGIYEITAKNLSGGTYFGWAKINDGETYLGKNYDALVAFDVASTNGTTTTLAVGERTRIYLHYVNDTGYGETNPSFEFEVSIRKVDDNTKRMCFDIGDYVTPMVFGADGQDRPMSLYNDGTPKVFQVVGTKIFYDGAVWQELSLQEV